MRDDAFSHPLRVLVVDDCRDMTASMGLLLRCWGHDTREAHGGAEALSAAAAFRPDVILLDIGLPDMDGWQVARRLREDLDLRDAFLASLTGYGQPEDCDRSLKAGCNRHLVKPVAPEVLQQILASWMKERDEAAVSQGQKSAASLEDRLDRHALERAESRLRGHSYLALKTVSCECLDGVLTLRGCLPTYYLKQVAQASVAGVEGVDRIDNRIQVIAGAERKIHFRW